MRGGFRGSWIQNSNRPGVLDSNFKMGRIFDSDFKKAWILDSNLGLHGHSMPLAAPTYINVFLIVLSSAGNMTSLIQNEAAHNITGTVHTGPTTPEHDGPIQDHDEMRWWFEITAMVGNQKNVKYFY